MEYTGGLCPLTLCAKGLLNGPCGGGENGMCEVGSDRECGWVLIYERLKKLNRLDLMNPYREPKNFAKWSRPRSLQVSEIEATFCSQDGKITISNQD
ncbi:MAG: methylenetetrahydrofolate reductase C-terminal domain-containing protein [Deltaproteobacteria bacterium]|nr:methylenetetrahydrofolate reductase C-terminal domain-containing protein [Deltaproteobacteria bacterium]